MRSVKKGSTLMIQTAPNGKPYQKLVTAADGHIVTRMFCEICITNGTFERHRNNCEHYKDEE